MQRLAIAPTQIHLEKITLSPEQHHYLSRVLRLREGDRFIAMNGFGQSWIATLAGTSAQIVEALEVKSELPVQVTLVAALPKGNGFDEVVRDCTALGVSCILPVISDRTLIKPSSQKLDRWRRIAGEAAEQAERQIIPTILEPVTFTAGLLSLSCHTVKEDRYICFSRRDSPHLLHCLQDKCSQSTSIVIAIGPEGGWTDKEVEQAIEQGFKTVSLGSRIFRAVLAPVVALSIVAAAFEKL